MNALLLNPPDPASPWKMLQTAAVNTLCTLSECIHNAAELPISRPLRLPACLGMSACVKFQTLAGFKAKIQIPGVVQTLDPNQI